MNENDERERKTEAFIFIIVQWSEGGGVNNNDRTGKKSYQAHFS